VCESLKIDFTSIIYLEILTYNKMNEEEKIKLISEGKKK
jgi:hypothetical protein